MRALAIEPKILLLDEPFGALDAKVRQGLRKWLRQLHDEIHITSVLVTHDQEEALEVADRIVVMNQARIEQVGTPDQVFHHPATPFVMDFLGRVNLFHGRFSGAFEDPGWRVEPNGGKLFVRPHELALTVTPTDRPAVRGTVLRVQTAGALVKLEVQSETGDTIQVDLAHDQYWSLNVKRGDTVFVSPREARLF